ALFLNQIFLASLLVVACLAAGVRFCRAAAPTDASGAGKLAGWLGAATLSVLWICLTFEVHRYFVWTEEDSGSPRGAWVAQMAVSVTWTIYAVGLLAGGFLRRIPALRYSAFALLGLCVLKAVIVDMAQVRQIYRIVSLLALGLVLVGVSYLYH